MAEEKPSTEAPNEETADTDTSDGGKPPPAPAMAPLPKPEISSPPPDHAPSTPPPPPPPAVATGAAPETLPAPNSSAHLAAVAALDCRSFSQLIASAMASPVGSQGSAAPILALPVDPVRFPIVAIPCFLAPASLLESPAFTCQFTVTHQAVLATVTTQAQLQLQAAHPTSSSEVLPSSFPQPTLSTISPVPLQQRPPSVHEDSVCTPQAEQPQSFDRRPKSAHSAVKTNPDDGYNWRKYGQKQVKSSENSRSYYKCTGADCSAKKNVVRCPDGRVIEVMYRGEHNHDPPQQTRYSRERVVRIGGSLGENESLELPSSEPNESDPSISKTEQNSGNETPEQQLFCSSDCEGDAAIKAEDLGDEPDPKRRLSERTVPYATPVLKTFREPKIVVQDASDVGRVSDGYKWRKYGQKIVKGNPNPRSYYRCTHNGCPVRKHVERASDDARAIVMTYEGKHNHDLPGPKNSSDPPVPLISSPVAETRGEQLHSPDSLLEQKSPADVNEKSTGEKALELGGEKALESAQALLSIGCNSSAGKDAGGTDSEDMKRPLFNENPAAVPVHNS